MSIRYRLGAAAAVAALLVAGGGVARADDIQSDAAILQELRSLQAKMREFDAMKARIEHLETQLQKDKTGTTHQQAAESKRQAAAAHEQAIEAQKQAAAAQEQAVEAQKQAASAQQQAAEAKKQAGDTAATNANATQVLNKLAKGQLQIGRTNVSLNGWVEASFNRREHDELAGPSSSSLLTPFPAQGQFHTNEFRMGPPQTRFGINTTSDVTDDLVLKTKLEFDLLSGSNATGTANGQSWTPRVRHAWAEIDDAATGWHFLGGQAYSLTIPSGNMVGADGSDSPDLAWTLLPGTEATSTPDDGMLAGLGATRNVQFRVVKEVASNAAVAVSMENPQMSWGGDKGTAIVSPITSNASYNSTTQFVTLSTMPDLVAKIGYDPTPRYHFEAWGIFRQYKDTSLAGDLPDVGTVYTGGAGLSTYVKIIPKKLDTQLGVGYGSFGSQIDGVIPDATYDSKGKPIPVFDKYLYGEIIGHPTTNLDLYLQAGVEQGDKAGVSGNSTASAYGYGNPYNAGRYGNTDCLTYNYLGAGNLCSADTHTVWNIAFTPVWRILNNPAYGHVDFLPTVQYWQRELFRDQFGRIAHSSNWAVDVAFRYWPF